MVNCRVQNTRLCAHPLFPTVQNALWFVVPVHHTLLDSCSTPPMWWPGSPTPSDKGCSSSPLWKMQVVALQPWFTEESQQTSAYVFFKFVRIWILYDLYWSLRLLGCLELLAKPSNLGRYFWFEGSSTFEDLFSRLYSYSGSQNWVLTIHFIRERHAGPVYHPLSSLTNVVMSA